MLKKLVNEGARAPRGYGQAWVEFDCRRAAYYPVPLNWVARYIRELYYWLRFPGRQTLTEKITTEVGKPYETRLRKQSEMYHTARHRADAWTRMSKELGYDPDTSEKLG